MPETLGGSPIGGEMVGGRRRGASVKTLKKLLKKAGLKTTGRKAALTRRAKKAHLKMRGGAMSKDEAKAALEAAVVNNGDVAKAKADALDAGWTQAEVDGVVAAASTSAATPGGRRRRRGSRRGVFGKLF